MQPSSCAPFNTCSASMILGTHHAWFHRWVREVGMQWEGFSRLFSSQHTAPWASYQIRKIAGCACAGNTGYDFPRRRIQRKPLVSDPGIHHGTCVKHVPWCMSGMLTRVAGKTSPAFPAHAHPKFDVFGKMPIIYGLNFTLGQKPINQIPSNPRCSSLQFHKPITPKYDKSCGNGPTFAVLSISSSSTALMKGVHERKHTAPSPYHSNNTDWEWWLWCWMSKEVYSNAVIMNK